ncbi:poly-beta-1,6-N-acetyl-D-glucosamine N-deacetylase PgaB [Pelosinus sp. sgz500959]|uniref:poly-beta-1,6-N-acetyl-D-glucosamine N-deacetylase PgaB n=1 Tax=Pelosinus sp. sgz500959 TaxID=3242472 RepID=UPI00366FF99E
MFAGYKCLCLMIIAVLFMMLSPAYAAGTAIQDVIVLCYHDVGKTTNGEKGINQYTVTKENLMLHFNLLKKMGFQPISAQQYLEAKQGKVSLPAKAVMLTFDDGYISFYKDVFPLLKEFNYPAMFALVTSWQQFGAAPSVGSLVNWDQVREMESSGLVTIASHSHNMHKFVVNNSFTNWGQEAASLVYSKDGYETRENYQKRMMIDMDLNQRVFEQNLGHRVKFYVWPFGAYTKVGAEIAQRAGMELLFTLDDDINTAMHQGLGVNREIIYDNPGEKEFLQLLSRKSAKPAPLKVGQLDIDLIYDASPIQFENNIDMAIEFLESSGVNTVFLQAFADDKGTGNIESVYFYTTVAPVKQDVFSHVVQRLQDKGMKVYAWVPTLACQWLLKGHSEDRVQASDPLKEGWYTRATPFSLRVREELKKLFRDLAVYSTIDGILFQDDLYLNDFEDLSPAAKKTFQEQFHQELTTELLKNKEIMQEWTNMKSKVLNDITMELMEEVYQYRPRAKVARNIYPNVIVTPESKEWMAQDYEEYLKLYDYTVIMAYPFMEKVPDSNQWLAQLTQFTMSKSGAADKTIFKLQSYNWDKQKWISSLVLSKQVAILKSKGAFNLAYYPLNIYSVQEKPLFF